MTPDLPPGRWSAKIQKTLLGIAIVSVGLLALRMHTQWYVWLPTILLGTLVMDSEVVAAPLTMLVDQAVKIIKAVRGGGNGQP